MIVRKTTFSLGGFALLISLAAAGMMVSSCGFSFSFSGGSTNHSGSKRPVNKWVEMAKQHQHQPIALWQGLSAGSVTESSSSVSGCKLEFRSTPTQVLERQLDKLLKKKPLTFLPLFDATDPQVVLVGIYVYQTKLGSGLLRKLRDGQKAQIAAAFRKLLQHRDTRMRWAAIQTLGENRWLTVDDIRQGLNDETADVRYTTMGWVLSLVDKEPHYNPEGALIEADPDDVERLVETKRKLAPILLEHLNDTHFHVRYYATSRFCRLFKLVVADGSGTREFLPPVFPTQIDWIRSDWHSRDKTQKEWKDWWTEYGEEALRWAHPAQ